MKRVFTLLACTSCYIYSMDGGWLNKIHNLLMSYLRFNAPISDTQSPRKRSASADRTHYIKEIAQELKKLDVSVSEHQQRKMYETLYRVMEHEHPLEDMRRYASIDCSFAQMEDTSETARTNLHMEPADVERVFVKRLSQSPRSQ